MRLINKNSRRGIVNLFADFIVSKIDPKERSIIQITDCEVFMVLNGQTTSETELNIDELKNEFNETYKDILKSLGLEHFNVINIIKYGVDISPIETGWVDTNKKVFIEENESFDEISINSEFPYGYSLRTGRSMVYYSHYILNQISSTIGSDNMFIHFLPKVDDEMDIKVVSSSRYDSKIIKSLILDVFNFDLEDFSNRMESYDLIQDILDPEGLKPYLVQDRLEDVIIF
jgi:hypothetical protein